MSQNHDESVDPDLLLAFSTEPGGKPTESPELLGARVEFLERSVQQASSQIHALQSEVATLVGTIDDIAKKFHLQKAPAPGPRHRSGAASRLVRAAGVLAIAIVVGALGWMMWPRGLMDTTATASQTVAESPQVEPTAALAPEAPAPVAPPPPAVPQIVAASVPVARPARVQPRPSPAASDEEPIRTPVDYVGTLSIDATPAGQVFIDRRAVGQTPLRIPNLKAGSHLVWIERDGYRRFTRVVQVPADRISRVSAELEPLAPR